MVTNYELKQKAREALKDNWQIALMVALIASLPSLAGQVVSIMTQSGMTQVLNNMLTTVQSNATIGDVAALMEQSGVTAASYTPSLLLNLLSGILSPFLTLGLLNYTFKLLRHEDDALIGTVFSRKNCFFKAIGLNIMVFLRTLLWMLPGMALEILAMVALVLLPENLSFVSVVLLYGGMIAMLVLGIRAAFHYAMATRVMAETPSVGINQAIRESVQMMSNRKMLLFSLEMSFILYNIGITLLETLLLSIVGSVLASTVSMVASFVVSVYMQTAVSAFYLVYRQQSTI